MKNIPIHGFIFIICLCSKTECNLCAILARYLRNLTKVNIISALFFSYEVTENPLSNGKESTLIGQYNFVFFQCCYFLK